MDEKHKRMSSGELYDSADPELMAEQAQLLDKQYEFNQSKPSETKRRAALLKEMFAQIGSGVWIEPPLHANWAGAHDYLGDNVYANFNLTLIDDADIHIGDNTMMGPNVTLATASHPVLASLRTQGLLQYNLPITIGKNCWIGAGVIILAGVTIGDNTVIGAGSMVNKSLPANVVAVGDPCKVLRPIDERDREFYGKGRRIDWEKFPDLAAQEGIQQQH